MGSECIINVGNGQWFTKGSVRLQSSLEDVGFEGDVMVWTEWLPDGSPSHEENPYAMKIYAFEAALKAGHTTILWLDSSVWAIKHPTFHMEEIRTEGYYLFHTGFNTGQWTNDQCLEYFKMSREEADAIPMCAGGILGLNFETEIAQEFFAQWKAAMLAGAFKGSWTSTETEHAHRHDQSCASIIAHRLGMTMHPYQVYDYYWDEGMPETAEFALRGM